MKPNRSNAGNAAWPAAWLCKVLLLAAVSIGTTRAAETYSFSQLNRLVPDGSLSGLSDTHFITSSIVHISSLRVHLNIEGEFNGDLYGYVRHVQAGRTNLCVLINRPGRTAGNAFGYAGAGLDVVFDDTAGNGDIHQHGTRVVPSLGTPLTGVWQPDGRNVAPTAVLESSARTTSLGSFAGASAQGEWTLYLADADAGGAHVLKSWSLEIRGASAPPTLACLVHYPFEEASGTNAFDSSGRGNHAILLNGPTRASGIVKRALRFDGSNDRVVMTNATSLNVTGAFTLACWVRPESVSDSRWILMKGNDNDLRFSFALRTSSARLQYRWVSPSGSENRYGTTANVLAVGRWTHIAVTHVPGNRPTIFINAVPVSGTLAGGSASALLGSSTFPFTLGSSFDGSSPFRGWMDDVMVCPTALTAAQIQALTNGVPIEPPALAIVTTSPLPEGRVHAAYSHTLMATGGSPAYTWAVMSGALPAGLLLNTNSGALSGTPGIAGTNGFRVRARDSAGLTREIDLTLVILNPRPPIITTASLLPAGTISNAYSQTLSAADGVAPYNWGVAGGALPPGLTLATHGTISGVPLAAGTNSFRARVTDLAGQSGEKDFVLVISSASTGVPSLVYYKFDEPSGTIAFDSSGHGHHGSLLNGPTRTNGLRNGALRFDGSNDRVTGGNPPLLNHTGAVTIAVWARPESVSGGRILVIKGRDDDEGYAWQLRASDARLAYRWVDPNGDRNEVESGNNVLVAGRWTHVAAVHTPGTRPLLYVNGVLTPSNLEDGSASARIRLTSNPFTVGASSDGAQAFRGSLDEVLVCGRALAATEIPALLPEPVASPQNGLATPAPPVILELRVVGPTATVVWSALPGQVYRVQYKHHVDSTEWLEVSGSITAGDTRASFQEAAVVQRFYRIVCGP